MRISASSITNMSNWSKWKAFLFSSSLILPLVPITSSALFRLKNCKSSLIGNPPMTDLIAIFLSAGKKLLIFRACWKTWFVSSRVGNAIIALKKILSGFSDSALSALSAGTRSNLPKIIDKKDIVLPVPDFDCAIIFLACSPIGIVAVWIGLGFT